MGNENDSSEDKNHPDDLSGILNLDAVKGSINELCADIENNDLGELFLCWTDKKGKWRWRAFGNLFKTIGLVDCSLGHLRAMIISSTMGKRKHE